MTDTRFDRAPGGRPIPTGLEEEASSGLLVYSIGFALAVILTVTSFWAANTSLLWGLFVALPLRRPPRVWRPTDQIKRRRGATKMINKAPLKLLLLKRGLRLAAMV
jgi:hypothetical protein